MESEGTSRDDLDVRLHWPGAEPEGLADLPNAESDNGAPADRLSVTGKPGAARGDRAQDVPTHEAGDHRSSEIALDVLQDAVRSISHRIDRLVSRFEANQRALEGLSTEASIVAAFQRVERTLADLAESSATSEAALGASLDQIREELARVSKRQADDLQRFAEISHQVEALRRRLALRARADHELSPEAIQLISEAVAERLSAGRAPVREAGPRSGRDARRK
jgi:ABC-type transporter Mla subunit MlaD